MIDSVTSQQQVRVTNSLIDIDWQRAPVKVTSRRNEKQRERYLRREFIWSQWVCRLVSVGIRRHNIWQDLAHNSSFPWTE